MVAENKEVSAQVYVDEMTLFQNQLPSKRNVLGGVPKSRTSDSIRPSRSVLLANFCSDLRFKVTDALGIQLSLCLQSARANILAVLGPFTNSKTTVLFWTSESDFQAKKIFL